MKIEHIINPFEIPAGKKHITKQEYVKNSTQFLQEVMTKNLINNNDINGMLLSIFVDWKKVDPQLKYKAWKQIVSKIGANNYLRGVNNNFTLAHILAMAGSEIVMDSIYIKMMIFMLEIGMNPFNTIMNPISPYEQAMKSKNQVFLHQATTNMYLEEIDRKQHRVTFKR